MSVLKTILKLAAPLPDITKYERYLFLGPHPDDIVLSDLHGRPLRNR